jgi:hypothetical protein
MSSNVPVIAGIVSTGIFAVSTMPMVLKAARTRDLSSYSGGNLLLSNLGNVLYAIYVFSMPMGPAWALYGFNLTVSATMLVYWLQYRTSRPRTRVATASTGADAVTQPPHRPSQTATVPTPRWGISLSEGRLVRRSTTHPLEFP